MLRIAARDSQFAVRGSRLAGLFLAFLLFHPRPAFSLCGTSGYEPLCKLYEQYDVVFDGTVVSIEPLDLDRLEFGKLEPFPHRVVTFAVHRSWKGLTGSRVQLLLPGGLSRDGKSSIHVSETLEVQAGVRYVIFADVDRNGYLETSSCSPSKPYHAAVEALEFLQSLDRPPTGGLITGYVSTRSKSLRPDATEPPPGITRVTLSGTNLQRSVEVTDGPFRFGGLPPGDYSVSVTGPPGMRNGPPQTVTIANPRGCEGLWFSNIPDTRVSGVITSSEGKPLKGVLVELADAGYWKRPPFEAMSAHTDEAGLFEFFGIPPGRYVVGVNLENEVSESRPFPRVLYTDGHKPFEVVIATGQALELGVLRLPPTRKRP